MSVLKGFFAAAAVALASCAGSDDVPVYIHPYIEKVFADTSMFAHKVLSEYVPQHSYSITILGEDAGVLKVANHFASFDRYDNIDGSRVSDGIEDFSGEVIDVLIDDANAPYRGYAETSNQLFLREIVLKNIVSALSPNCYANGYDQKMSEQKLPAKAIVLGSIKYVPEVLSDIDTLMGHFGVDVPVIFAAESAVDYIFSNCKDISCIGVLADLDVAGSGVYGKLIGERSVEQGYNTPVVSAVFSPDGDTPSEKIRNFMKMYVDSGIDLPLTAVIVDDPFLASKVGEMYAAIDTMTTELSEVAKLYDMMIADDFFFVNPVQCVCEDLFEKLRDDNMMALRIAPPDFAVHVSIPAPEYAAEDTSGRSILDSAFRYNRAYNSDIETYKIVRMSRRHVNARERALIDSVANDISLEF